MVVAVDRAFFILTTPSDWLQTRGEADSNTDSDVCGMHLAEWGWLTDSFYHLCVQEPYSAAHPYSFHPSVPYN